MYELEFPAPQLSSSDGRGPVLIHALEGFSDAGHAIRLAAEHLKNTLDTELVASFAIDELLDYRSRRPLMTFKTDHFTHYDEPELNLYALHDSVGTPFLLLAGMEPDLRWERFITAVRLLAERLGVRQTIGLGTIPMAVPHTRPDHADRALQQQGADRRSHAVGGRGAGPRQRVQPAGVPDGPARTRRRRVHRPRAALPGPDRLPGRRRGAARRRSPRPASLQLPLAALTEAAAEVQAQDRRTGRGQRRGRSSGGGTGAPVRCLRRRSGEPVAAGTRRGSAQR